jgi:hypothetical protein
VRRALRSDAPPAFHCPARPSKLDPFKDEIHRLLSKDPDLPAVRVHEEIEPLGFDGAQTIVNDYVREVRPRFAVARTEAAMAASEAGGEERRQRRSEISGASVDAVDHYEVGLIAVAPGVEQRDGGPNRSRSQARSSAGLTRRRSRRGGARRLRPAAPVRRDVKRPDPSARRSQPSSSSNLVSTRRVKSRS